MLHSNIRNWHHKNNCQLNKTAIKHVVNALEADTQTQIKITEIPLSKTMATSRLGGSLDVEIGRCPASISLNANKFNDHAARLQRLILHQALDFN